MKSFNNKNIEYSLVIHPENLMREEERLALKRVDFGTFKVKYDQVATSFVGPYYPISIRMQSDHQFVFPNSFSNFDLFSEDKRKLPVDYDTDTLHLNPSIFFNRECEFSKIPFKEGDYCFSSAVERYFLNRLQSGVAYREIPFILCFLERYCMEHDELVLELQEKKYQKNRFVKQYVSSFSHYKKEN